MTTYDIAIIGKGLMGSAALRHLTLAFPELNVCVIGPDEPQERKSHQGVFASHYDQGRITRILDPSQIWGQLARESIQRYAEIEAMSGLRFHHRAGCLRATDLAARSSQDLDECARHISAAASTSRCRWLPIRISISGVLRRLRRLG